MAAYLTLSSLASQQTIPFAQSPPRSLYLSGLAFVRASVATLSPWASGERFPLDPAECGRVAAAVAARAEQLKMGAVAAAAQKLAKRAVYGDEADPIGERACLLLVPISAHHCPVLLPPTDASAIPQHSALPPSSELLQRAGLLFDKLTAVLSALEGHELQSAGPGAALCAASGCFDALLPCEGRLCERALADAEAVAASGSPGTPGGGLFVGSSSSSPRHSSIFLGGRARSSDLAAAAAAARNSLSGAATPPLQQTGPRPHRAPGGAGFDDSARVLSRVRRSSCPSYRQAPEVKHPARAEAAALLQQAAAAVLRPARSLGCGGFVKGQPDRGTAASAGGGSPADHQLLHGLLRGGFPHHQEQLDDSAPLVAMPVQRTITPPAAA